MQRLQNAGAVEPAICSFLSIFVGVEFCEDVVVLLLEDVDGHVEVMVLHGGGGVDGGERGAHVDHELVVEAPVVEIVTESSHPQTQTLVWTEDIWRSLNTIIGRYNNVYV